MDGTPSCASTEPSANSVSACTTDCGCTTTSMASNGSPNRKCASITSSALFTSEALSIEIFLPMRHVGWLSASCTVAWATRSAGQPRNGPPEGVRIKRLSGGPTAERRH